MLPLASFFAVALQCLVSKLFRLSTSRLISCRFHILVWLFTWILSFSCRLFLVLHFDVVSSIGLRLSTSLAVGLLLILFSLALLAFLLRFLLWLRGWRIQDWEDFRPQRVDLVFYLLDGIWQIFVLRCILQFLIDLNEIRFHHTNFVSDALLPFLSQGGQFTRCCRGKFRLDILSLEFLEERNPLADFASKPVPGLDWVANGTESGCSLTVLFQGCLLAFTVDPVNRGLEVLDVGVPQSRVNVVLVIAIAVQVSLQVVGVSL